MPTVTREITVRGSLGNVWRILSDPVELGKCIPGCEEVVPISPTESRWRMKVMVGVIAKRVDSKVRTVLSREREELAFKVESVDGSLNADFHIHLKEAAPEATLISLTANVEAGGSFQWVVNQVIRTQLDRFVAAFTDCISSKATV